MKRNFDPNINLPQYLFLEITTECNLKCKQCHMWISKEPALSLTTDDKLDLIHQFYEINSEGVVVLTGGETMLKENEFFALTKLCKTLDLTCATNTNASLINDSNLERIFTEGPKYLVVSLDSHIEKIHDYIRGVKGTYKHTVDILKKLSDYKSKHNKTETKIITNSIVFDRNIDLIPDYIEFAKETLKIDGVMFQMLSRTFWNRKKTDVFFDKHFFKDKEKSKKYINTIMNLPNNDGFVLTETNDFEWMKLYVDNPDFIGEQVCASHKKNIMIDQMGDVQLCFSMRGLMNGQALGNVKNISLKEVWSSNKAEKAREIMSSCRKNCGMLNCHRE